MSTTTASEAAASSRADVSSRANTPRSKRGVMVAAMTNMVLPVPTGVIKMTKGLAIRSANKFRQFADAVTQSEVAVARRYASSVVSEVNPHQFAIVFKGDMRDLRHETHAELVGRLRPLASQGVSFDLLYSNDPADLRDRYRFIVILVRMGTAVIEDASKALQLERWMNSGCQSSGYDDTRVMAARNLTSAEYIQCGALVLERAEIDEGFNNVHALLTLPCKRYTERLVAIHFRQLTFRRLWNIIKGELFMPRKNSSDRIEAVAASAPKRTARELTDDESYQVGYDFYVHEIRRHAGETLALQYAFAVHFVNWLVAPAIISFFVCLCELWLASKSYKRLLTIYAVSISAIWMPLMLRYWQRKCAELAVIWGTTDSDERTYVNPAFRDAEGGRPSRGNRNPRSTYYSPTTLLVLHADWSRWLRVYPFYLIYFMVQLLIMVTGTSISVTSIVYIRSFSCNMVQVEEACISSKTRWFLTAVLSVAMGLIMSFFQWRAKYIAGWFTRLENHRRETDHNKSIIQKTYWMQWASLYSWFLTIAFVFVPLGAGLHDFLQMNFSWFLVFNHTETTFDLFDTLAAPLFVNLIVNMLIGTVIPLIADFARHRRQQAAAVAPREMRPLNADLLAEATAFANMLKTAMYAPSAIGTCCPPDQQTYREVLEMFAMPHLASHSDYDDKVVHLGMLTAFSCLSPLLALIILASELLELHADLTKTMFRYRRAQPRKVKDAGAWEAYFIVSMVLGGMITSGLICFSTGHLEAFIPSCVPTVDVFGPDWTCVGDLSTRMAVFVLLEHIILITQMLTYASIKHQPKWIEWRLFKIQKLKRQFMKDLKRTQLGLKARHPSLG